VACAVRGARRAVLLSGTPSLSRPYDLYRQVDALSPGLLGRSRTDFAQAYCGRRLVPVAGRGGERHRKWHVGGLSRGPELHDLLRAEVMVRRLKRDVLSQVGVGGGGAGNWACAAPPAKRLASAVQGGAAPAGCSCLPSECGRSAVGEGG
jgi:hypothetical protein